MGEGHHSAQCKRLLCAPDPGDRAADKAGQAGPRRDRNGQLQKKGSHKLHQPTWTRDTHNQRRSLGVGQGGGPPPRSESPPTRPRPELRTHPLLGASWIPEAPPWGSQGPLHFLLTFEDDRVVFFELGNSPSLFIYQKNAFCKQVIIIESIDRKTQ